jgi:hypothetical protein
VDAFAASGLSEEGSSVSGFTAYDPYPQPAVFRAAGSRIYFPIDIPVGGRMLSIQIFSFTGERVMTIEHVVSAPGRYKEPSSASDWDGQNGAPFWNGLNYTGDAVAPGIYFYTMRLFGCGAHRGKVAVIR